MNEKLVFSLKQIVDAVDGDYVDSMVHRATEKIFGRLLSNDPKRNKLHDDVCKCVRRLIANKLERSDVEEMVILLPDENSYGCGDIKSNGKIEDSVSLHTKWVNRLGPLPEHVMSVDNNDY